MPLTFWLLFNLRRRKKDISSYLCLRSENPRLTPTANQKLHKDWEQGKHKARALMKVTSFVVENEISNLMQTIAMGGEWKPIKIGHSCRFKRVSRQHPKEVFTWTQNSLWADFSGKLILTDFVFREMIKCCLLVSKNSTIRLIKTFASVCSGVGQ